MSKQRDKQKCPKCEGPVKIVGNYLIGKATKYEYRSTATGQLEHVKTISQSMAEENDKLHRQLADKERELATEKQRKETAIRFMNDNEDNLAATNAVVDEARKLDELDDKVLEANYADISDEEYDAITDARDLQMSAVCDAVKKYDEWRKLQEQLADKERELTRLRAIETAKEIQDITVKLLRSTKIQQHTKLTAANAVIEAAHKKLQEWAETDESFVHTPAHSAAESAIEILSRYIDKLQGGK